MYSPIEGGTSEVISHLTCYIPPQPPREDIAYHDLHEDEQYWRRTPLPEWWAEKYKAEQIKRETDPKYIDAQLQKFRNQEWKRRLNGYWFYNKGVATYLTGTCYFFMNWWRGGHQENDGYATYADEIRRRFYFRQYCAEDQHCLGYVISGSRGFGKTYEESCCLVESLTKTPRKREGVIQSKSEEDAKKKVFQSKIVPSYNDLPEFFKPISNHGTHPEKGLSFFRDSVRGKGKKSVTFDDNEELQNILYPVPAKEKYLSGGSYAEIFMDEIGVTDPKKEADVDIRLQVNRFCVYRNNKKIGLMRCTTTVEEIDKGGKEFKKVWDKSDQRVRTGNGFTTSGIYRMFVSDIQTSNQFLDKYGFIDVKKAREFHDNERKAREKDYNELMSYIRKNPRTEQEMFYVKSNRCHFDAFGLTQRYEAIKQMDTKPYRFGMFQRVNGVANGNVEWIPCFHPESEYDEDRDTGDMYCSHCRFVVSYLPPSAIINNVSIQSFGSFTEYTPNNQIKFTAGLDPYQNSIVLDEDRGSKSGFYIKMKYDPIIDNPEEPLYNHFTDAPCLEYIYRAGDVYEMYNDVLNAIWYYGCCVFPETNKRGFLEWMKQNGYGGFLTMKPKGITNSDSVLNPNTDGGASSTTPMIQHYTDLIEADVKRNVHKYPFPRLIYQLLHFDNTNTTKFDGAVAWGFTLVSAQKKVQEKKVETNVSYWRVYDEYGNEIK